MIKEYPRYVVPSITSIQDMLIRSAKVYGEKLALEDLADNSISSVTFKQLHDKIW